MPEILDGRYVLREEHQSGGMATIYKARRIDNDELVAIKRFDKGKHLPEFEAEAYRREVEALQNLQHPNILRIIEHGEDPNRKPYLVLEWMPNDLVSLRDRGSTAFDGWDDFADQVALPLLEALAHAHANSFCHRDVKPANVLIAEDGQVKLADFGISKLKRCLQPRITLNEFASRPYAPAERDEEGLTYSSDVYAFGVVCLWALSDSALQTSADIGPALASIDVVPEIREILGACVHRDPAQRPRTAGVVSHELARVQAERRAVWAAKARKHCRIRLTHTAMLTVGDLIQSQDESTIKHFVDGDINDSSTISPFYARKGTPEERLIPDQYFVCGARIAYQIGIDDKNAKQFVVIKAIPGDAWRLQQMKQEGLPMPVTFDLSLRVGSTPAKDIVPLLAQALLEFEEEKKREYTRTAEESLFAGCANYWTQSRPSSVSRLPPSCINPLRFKATFSLCKRPVTSRALRWSRRESSKRTGNVSGAPFIKSTETASSSTVPNPTSQTRQSAAGRVSIPVQTTFNSIASAQPLKSCAVGRRPGPISGHSFSTHRFVVLPRRSVASSVSRTHTSSRPYQPPWARPTSYSSKALPAPGRPSSSSISSERHSGGNARPE